MDFTMTGTVLTRDLVVADSMVVAARGDVLDLVVLRDLMAAGKVTPVIDRTYKLSETAEAMRYFEEGHARGKVVITVEQNEQASIGQ